MKELFSFDGLWLAMDYRRGSLWILADKFSITFDGIERICIPLHCYNLWIGIDYSSSSITKKDFLIFTIKCGDHLEKSFYISAKKIEIVGEAGRIVAKMSI